jgi:regulator of replication initiation timing
VFSHDPERRLRVTRDLQAVLDENDQLQAENAQLRALLREHGIDPEGPAADTG